MKIGILGGSFDPIHNGHLYMARQAYEDLGLDEVWLIPAGHSPNKDENKMTGQELRYDMCRLAAAEYPWLKVSRIEIDSEERSYTYRTMERLAEQYVQDEFYFIMGGDSLDYFKEWRHPEIICAHAVLAVIPRVGFEMVQMQQKLDELRELFPCDVRLISCEEYVVSSTEIRDGLKHAERLSSELCRKWFPEGVFEYICQERLYGIGQPLSL